MNWARVKKIVRASVWLFIIITGTIAGTFMLIMDSTDEMYFQPVRLTESDRDEILQAIDKREFPIQSIPLKFKDNLIDMLYVRAQPPDYAVLVAHDGSGSMYSRLDMMRELYEMGFSVLMFDYRGCGASSGEALDDTEMRTDIFKAYGKLRQLQWNSSRIILYGQGAGAAMAAEVAVDKGCYAWIAENPFISFSDLMRDPLRKLLMIHRFETGRFLPEMTMPKWVIAGDNHPYIPADTEAKLQDLSPDRFEICRVSEGDHRPVFSTHPAAWHECMDRFTADLQRAAPVKSPAPHAAPPDSPLSSQDTPVNEG